MLVAVAVAAGCSDPDPDNVVSPTTRVPSPSEVSLPTTTTVAGGRTDAEYQALSLTPAQSSCLTRSDVDRALDVTLPEQPGDPIEVFVADDLSVTLPAGLRTGSEVWRPLLLALAGTCLSPTEVDPVAAALGADDDRRAIERDLPTLLEDRSAAGFDPAELACVESVLRDAPARISSLAADPRVADAQCVGGPRLEVLLLGVTRSRLQAIDAQPGEIDCLLATPADLQRLDDAAALFRDGDGGGVAELSSTCLDTARLGSLAVALAAQDLTLSGGFG